MVGCRRPAHAGKPEPCAPNRLPRRTPILLSTRGPVVVGNKPTWMGDPRGSPAPRSPAKASAKKPSISAVRKTDPSDLSSRPSSLQRSPKAVFASYRHGRSDSDTATTLIWPSREGCSAVPHAQRVGIPQFAGGRKRWQHHPPSASTGGPRPYAEPVRLRDGPQPHGEVLAGFPSRSIFSHSSFQRPSGKRPHRLALWGRPAMFAL